MDQMVKGMVFPGVEEVKSGYGNAVKVLKSGENFTLETANRLFVHEKYELVKDYEEVVKESFRAGMTTTNFGESEAARTVINDWVKGNTKEKIKDLIEEDILDANTRLVLVNAIYFKGDWAIKFDKSK